MADNTPLDDTELDALFAAARATEAAPSDDLVARIMADAETVAKSADEPIQQSVQKGWFGQLVGSIGGWPAVAGLATAAVTGVAIGVASPDTVDSWTGGSVTAALGYEVNDLFPSVGDLLEEG